MAITKRGLVLGAVAVTVSAAAIAGTGLHFFKGQALLQSDDSGQQVADADKDAALQPMSMLSLQSFFNQSPKELVDEVWQIIDRTYVDGTFNQVDWKKVRNDYLKRSYTNNEDAYKAIREMVKKIGDPYTRFMDPQEFRNMKIDTSGELTGVGIQLAADEKTKKLTVISPIEDSPAFTAGILSKDIILKIDGKSTEGMDVNKAVTLIRGAAGTSVKLTILRGTQQIDYAIKRARIEIHAVKSSELPSPQGKVGYIRLVQFSANAPMDMQKAIEKLEKQQVSGYVLDLRGNPGGLLYTSVDIARMWMSKGAIVSTKSRTGEQDKEQANGRSLTNKPLVVLVDGGSASASEILSGALQDNRRAVLIGTKTFGKGLVQSVRQVGKDSGLAVTIAKYYTPSGRDINKQGIVPDVEVQLTENQKKELSTNRDKVGTLEDPQVAKAVGVLGEKIQVFRLQSPRAETKP
ncbi:carboxyl-terminal processing protease CtpC [Leptolyngbya sp. Cla-17]|uniref:carboxyl-terminal processing protease CtpC n=1 Tax=Leptolyngbya sp. Cla-17 TaxID=2803751 RepID=UPI0018D80051|nr:carboxyl-terminal processing protease CtpC [Leptolyngbya sp. Cla-17]